MTVGVVGASRIGRKVVRLLRDVLDADVLIYDPYGVGDLTAGPRVRLASLEELLAASEVVSVHAPLTPVTRGMLDARGLALMRDGAVLPNVFLTPHIAGALGGEVLRLGRLAVEEVERYVAGLPLRYEVLPDQLDRLA